MVREKTSDPAAGARGHGRQKPKPREAGSRDARMQAQKTEKPRLEGHEPVGTRLRRHFVAAERAVSRPWKRRGRARHGLGTSPSFPIPSLTADPTGLTCVAHSSGEHCTRESRQMSCTSDAKIAVATPGIFLHTTEPRLPTVLAHAQL